jgi:hypothetical protein
MLASCELGTAHICGVSFPVLAVYTAAGPGAVFQLQNQQTVKRITKPDAAFGFVQPAASQLALNSCK